MDLIKNFIISIIFVSIGLFTTRFVIKKREEKCLEKKIKDKKEV